MREFDELTRTGQARRVRPQLADLVRDLYGLPDARVIHARTSSFNMVFELEADGQQYAMRLGGRHRIHPPSTEEVEATWLTRLAGETDILAPRPVGSTRRRHREDVELIGVPFTCPTSMFTWVDGTTARARLGTEVMAQLGAVSARLHEHAASVAPSIVVPDELHATKVVYFGDDHLDRHPITAIPVVREAVQRAQEAVNDLWCDSPHPPHLIHGDLSANNAVIRRGRLGVIDFQDLRFGFDVQDLGITVADLQRTRPDLVEPFRRGYETVRPWPECPRTLSDALAAGRRLNLVNLGVLLRRSGLEQFLEGHVRAITEWMSDSPPGH